MNTSPDIYRDGEEPGDPAYMYKPNLLGSPWQFALRRDGLAWEYGRRSGLIRYDEVQSVRLSYRPSSLQSYRFQTEIWSTKNPKVQIYSTSVRNLVEHTRQDADYKAFVREFHRRLAAAGSSARFVTGMNPYLYVPGAIVMAGCAVALIWLFLRTLGSGDKGGMALIVGMIALFVWQVGTLFHRNRPRSYRPDAVPDVVLPRG